MGGRREELGDLTGGKLRKPIMLCINSLVPITTFWGITIPALQMGMLRYRRVGVTIIRSQG